MVTRQRRHARPVVAVAAAAVAAAAAVTHAAAVGAAAPTATATPATGGGGGGGGGGAGADGLQATILSLAPDCDDWCAQRVGDRLVTAGCGGVRHFRRLGMVAARCPAAVAGAGTSRGGGHPTGEMSAAANDEADEGVLTSIPGVAAWAPDEGVTADVPVGGGARPPPTSAAASARRRPYLWGLDRINQATLPLDRRTATATCYPHAGAGVHVFVVDSGCRSDHAQFAHLAAANRLSIVPAVGSEFVSGEDDNGHGTHVAGTVAGRTTGVAPGVTLTCVKALEAGGRGSYADIISAFDMASLWAVEHPTVPVVLSASLGSQRPRRSRTNARGRALLDAITEAALRATDAGVVLVASAGNRAGDACDHTPASERHVIAVGNIDDTDAPAASSNWGRCVDVTAPGTDILSADYSSADGVTEKSGTSMAAPHVAGLAALVMAEERRRLPSAAVVAALTAPGGGRLDDGTPLAWLDADACRNDRGRRREH